MSQHNARRRNSRTLQSVDTHRYKNHQLNCLHSRIAQNGREQIAVASKEVKLADFVIIARAIGDQPSGSLAVNATTRNYVDYQDAI